MADRVIRIAVDAMGGDNYPDVLVAGSLEAVLTEKDIAVSLVGNSDSVTPVLNEMIAAKKAESCRERISVVHAEEVIGMHESPARAIRSRKNASIVVANKLCRTGDVDAVISAGNTGAAMASSLLYMGRLAGVQRPAILTLFPSKKNIVVIADVGANTDCKPENLYQFGVMASIFTKRLLGYENPRVALLNIGEEKGKGNDLTNETYDILEQSELDFIGNIEGRDIFEGVADVVVCDGFVGNVLLKFGESAFGFVVHNIRKKVAGNLIWKLAALMLKPALTEIKRDMTPEDYGGAPLLGVDGVSIICHGNSSALAIKNAVLVARKLVQEGMNEQIKQELAKTNSDNNE